MINGEDIKQLIPQRFPLMMVDEFEQNGENEAATALTIRKNNYFLLPDGTLSETGIIEHMAQSCSALAGYNARFRQAGGCDRAPIGLLGEVKHFESQRRVRAGQQVRTTIHFDLIFGSVTIARAVSTVEGDVVATGQLKIFMQP